MRRRAAEWVRETRQWGLGGQVRWLSMTDPRSLRTLPKSASRNKPMELVERYASRAITPVTIQQMLHLNKQKVSIAPHLREELMVRVAKRYLDMHELPPGLLSTESVQHVVHLYSTFFQNLSEMGTRHTEFDKQFSEVLRNFYLQDGSTLPAIALGMQEWGKKETRGSEPTLTARLDDLFTARLSIRMLIGLHCEIHGHSKIKRGLNVADTARQAAEAARKLCELRFGVCPEISIEGHLDFKFTYVESHLHHMLFELLKNSVRAVVEQHEGQIGHERRKRLKLSSKHLGANGLPPVLVAISGGKEDVVIKVSDEGGGIPRSDMGRIWSYEYTTATDKDRRLNKSKTQMDPDNPFLTFRENFYGMGYGLPIARVFARYFGGDLKVISTEGWGTDAYIFINRLESAAVETLPE